MFGNPSFWERLASLHVAGVNLLCNLRVRGSILEVLQLPVADGPIQPDAHVLSRDLAFGSPGSLGASVFVFGKV